MQELNLSKCKFKDPARVWREAVVGHGLGLERGLSSEQDSGSHPRSHPGSGRGQEEGPSPRG